MSKRTLRAPYNAEFFVPGIPQPKGSLHRVQIGRGASARVVNSLKTDDGEAWEQAICTAANEHRPASPLDGPVAVRAVFLLPRPKSVKRDTPHVKPDLDKLVRALLDGLERGGMVANDSRVCAIDCEKRYAARRLCGVSVWVDELDE